MLIFSESFQFYQMPPTIQIGESFFSTMYRNSQGSTNAMVYLGIQRIPPRMDNGTGNVADLTPDSKKMDRFQLWNRNAIYGFNHSYSMCRPS